MADLQTPEVLPPAGSFFETDRGYELRRDEYVPDGIRRIARGQLDDAHDQLEHTSTDDFGKAVHETRKSLKRLRACVRLSRHAIGEQSYRRENTVFRMTGQRLSDVRDARVLLETLGELEDRYPDELPPLLTHRLRERLKHDHERALETLNEDDRTINAVREELESARARTADWAFEADGFKAVEPGLERVYRRGRKRMRRARKDPSSEHLNDWRKRVKDLWHAAQLLRPAAPKQMKKLAKRAHKVANLLGDHHDLTVLRDYVDVHPHEFADEEARQTLVAVIERRRNVLERKALKLGKRLYRESPKRFVAAIRRGWRKRVPRSPQPVASRLGA